VDLALLVARFEVPKDQRGATSRKLDGGGDGGGKQEARKVISEVRRLGRKWKLLIAVERSAGELGKLTPLRRYSATGSRERDR